MTNFAGLTVLCDKTNGITVILNFVRPLEVVIKWYVVLLMKNCTSDDYDFHLNLPVKSRYALALEFDFVAL